MVEAPRFLSLTGVTPGLAVRLTARGPLSTPLSTQCCCEMGPEGSANLAAFIRWNVDGVLYPPAAYWDLYLSTGLRCMSSSWILTTIASILAPPHGPVKEVHRQARI
jgi:hypothetical protein